MRLAKALVILNLVLISAAMLIVAQAPGTKGAVYPLTELESARLAKLKAIVAKDDAQGQLLTLQYQQLMAERQQAAAEFQKSLDAVSERAKHEGVEVQYDSNTGEAGQFTIKSSAPAKMETTKPVKPQ